jgi:hypothetical protein
MILNHLRLIILLIITVPVHAMSVKPKQANNTFQYNTAEYAFDVPEFVNWKIQIIRQSIRYTPKGLNILLEVPPSVAFISEKDFNQNESKVLQEKMKNPNKVDYTIYFLKGYQSRVVKFESKGSSLFIKMPDDVSEHGLIASEVETMIQQTFKFLNHKI